jgi:predicted metal-dependent HD superfamily phosphohydrolase
MSVTLASWRAMWDELGVTPPDEALFNRIIAAYSEKQRHYHTLQHLRECLERLDEVRSRAERPAEIELALWFHDAVYDVRGTDNEERSADWAVSCIADPRVADRVHAMIMATKHAAEPTGHDTQLLVDADLAILGANAERFDEYDDQIRREYLHVPLAQFAGRRCRILGGFLKRPAIYSTPLFRERFESQARENLSRAIARWSQA